ncbi:acetyl-CoA carboxylase biotin carboxyl carrier protein, partial [Rugamonas sp. FT81W]|nr:acetyl-CoA carboxylase biotin carboxyl carrier protein [Duganella vulcania]
EAPAPACDSAAPEAAPAEAAPPAGPQKKIG